MRTSKLSSARTVACTACAHKHADVSIDDAGDGACSVLRACPPFAQSSDREEGECGNLPSRHASTHPIAVTPSHIHPHCVSVLLPPTHVTSHVKAQTHVHKDILLGGTDEGDVRDKATAREPVNIGWERGGVQGEGGRGPASLPGGTTEQRQCMTACSEPASTARSSCDSCMSSNFSRSALRSANKAYIHCHCI